MTLTPHTRRAWFLRITHSVFALVLVVGVFVALGFALGPGVAAFGFILTALMMVSAVWWGLRLRRRMETDPVATTRSIDRMNTAFGKFYAAVAFAIMGIGIVAIIAVFATHT